MSKYVVGARQNGLCPVETGRSEEAKAGEEWADMGRLLATRAIFLAWAVVQGHVWVSDPTTGTVWVDVGSSCDH